jgi:hypothetical protein
MNKIYLGIVLLISLRSFSSEDGLSEKKLWDQHKRTQERYLEIDRKRQLLADEILENEEKLPQGRLDGLYSILISMEDLVKDIKKDGDLLDQSFSRFSQGLTESELEDLEDEGELFMRDCIDYSLNINKLGRRLQDLQEVFEECKSINKLLIASNTIRGRTLRGFRWGDK